jgi:hypothetical protein
MQQASRASQGGSLGHPVYDTPQYLPYRINGASEYIHLCGYYTRVLINHETEYLSTVRSNVPIVPEQYADSQVRLHCYVNEQIRQKVDMN